jgi:hypothetical protein
MKYISILNQIYYSVCGTKGIITLRSISYPAVFKSYAIWPNPTVINKLFMLSFLGAGLLDVKAVKTALVHVQVGGCLEPARGANMCITYHLITIFTYRRGGCGRGGEAGTVQYIMLLYVPLPASHTALLLTTI